MDKREEGKKRDHFEIRYSLFDILRFKTLTGGDKPRPYISISFAMRLALSAMRFLLLLQPDGQGDSQFLA